MKEASNADREKGNEPGREEERERRKMKAFGLLGSLQPLLVVATESGLS